VSRCASASALYSLKMGVRVDYSFRHAFEQFIEGGLAIQRYPNMRKDCMAQIKMFKELSEDQHAKNKISIPGLMAEFNLLNPQSKGFKLDGDIRQYI
jgi:hypothetical protein